MRIDGIILQSKVKGVDIIVDDSIWGATAGLPKWT